MVSSQLRCPHFSVYTVAIRSTISVQDNFPPSKHSCNQFDFEHGSPPSKATFVFIYSFFMVLPGYLKLSKSKGWVLPVSPHGYAPFEAARNGTRFSPNDVAFYFYVPSVSAVSTLYSVYTYTATSADTATRIPPFFFSPSLFYFQGHTLILFCERFFSPLFSCL